MKRVCCHRRADPGFWSLIEILVVVAIMAVAFSVYWGVSGLGSRGGGLMDPTGTTTAVDLQNQLEGGGGRNAAPYGRPAQNDRPGPDGRPANADTSATNTTMNTTRAPYVRQPGSIPGRAIYKAHGEQCRENLRELRMMIQMATDDRGSVFPATLTDVPDSIKVRTCPIGGQDYIYDPNTGKVYCNTPGHENF
jgi:hypothetical protein